MSDHEERANEERRKYAESKMGLPPESGWGGCCGGPSFLLVLLLVLLMRCGGCGLISALSRGD